jgi:hypothetical protein
MMDYSWARHIRPNGDGKRPLIGLRGILTAICLISLCFVLIGCASVEKTLGAVDYACVDIEIDPHSSDSGMLGRGLVLPDGEQLTPQTIDLLCNY